MSRTSKPKAGRAGPKEPKAPKELRKPKHPDTYEGRKARREERARKRNEVPDWIDHACKCPEPACGCWLYQGDSGWFCPMRHTKITPRALFVEVLQKAIDRAGKSTKMCGKSLARRLLYHQRRRPGWK